MRTRSRGPTSPPPSEAKSRTKRRATLATVATVKPEQPDAADASPTERGRPEGRNEDGIILTPRKASKRVRFSDGDVRLVEGSTGLTPSLKRTRLSPGSTRIDKKRRTTLPPRLTFTPAPLPTIQEIQFTPLRQVLDGRMRRRLRRSHLSEEMNNIEEEKRDEEKTQKELEQLRAQGHDSEERIRDLMFEVESQRQLGIEINAEEEANGKAMTDELERLKQDLRASRPEASPTFKSLAPTERLPVDAPTEVDSDEDLWDDGGKNENSSPTMFNFSTSSPLPNASSPIGFSSPVRQRQLSVQALRQADDEALRQSRDMSEQLEATARQASDAQAALRTLRSDLSRLGFSDEPNAAPDTMILSMQDAFRRTRLELERLLPGETASGFENGLLLPAMVDHIRNLLADLHESHRTTASVRQSESALRGQFNSTLAKLQDMENRMTVVMAQRHNAVADAKQKEQAVKELECAASAHANIVQDRDSVIEGLEMSIRNMQQQLDGAGMRLVTLESERTDHSTTINRLQSALGSYRAEVTSVEALVGNLEKGRTEAVEQMNAHQQAATEQQARNEGLLARNKALKVELAETRQFLQDHVMRTRISLTGTLEDNEDAWRTAEAFLRRKDEVTTEREPSQQQGEQLA